MLLKGKGVPQSRPSHSQSGKPEVTRKNCRPNGAPPNGRQPVVVSGPGGYLIRLWKSSFC